MKKSHNHEALQRALRDAGEIQVMKEMQRPGQEFSPMVRNGRFWAGGYSSDTVDGLKRILGRLKGRTKT